MIARVKIESRTMKSASYCTPNKKPHFSGRKSINKTSSSDIVHEVVINSIGKPCSCRKCHLSVKEKSKIILKNESEINACKVCNKRSNSNLIIS